MGDLRSGASMLAAAPAPLLRGAAEDKPHAAAGAASLKIVHILRAPLGGLFRHVFDIARGQAERGHRVGLIVDSMTGGERAEAVLAELTPHLALGLERVPIARELGPSDVPALRTMARRIKRLTPHVPHCHRAQGAAL